MVEIGHTIAVVNKSGKVVSTSKHIMSVFKEAKNAYRERKAEIVADRQDRLHEKQLRRGVEVMTVTDESRSEFSERSARRRHHSEHRRGPELRIHPPTERHHSSSSVRSATSSRRSSSVSPRVPARSTSRSMPASPSRPSMALSRRHTVDDMALDHPTRMSPHRANTTTAIDMDLAYGDCHPGTLKSYDTRNRETEEISGLAGKVKALLEEADCARASVTATIAHLQKNPEAMAAVALTLAEISNLAVKIGPGALTVLKGSAPGVLALLAAPEFLIAAGVGVGITVVMFGGYKIIKKLKAKKDLEKEGASVDEMVALGDVNLDRIEHWRRGIADSQIDGSTVVDGEFITPMAARMRTEMPMAVPARGSSSTNLDDTRSSTSSKFRRKSKSKSNKADSSASGSSTGMEKKKGLIKVKKPSPLRMLFK